MHTRRMMALLAAASVLAALSGCSDKGEEDPKTSPTSEASSSASTSAEPARPDPPHRPSSRPPDRLITLHSTVSFHLPDTVEWATYGDKSLSVVAETTDVPDGAEDYVHVDATEFPRIDDDLAAMAESERTSQGKRRQIPLKTTGYRTIGGVRGFVLEGRSAKGQYYEWGALNAKNVLTTVCFIVPDGLDVADWVEPVLASLQWQ
ncbi:hypothetical protein G5V59_22945 [Nocardioides sp. W3-2-3]|uniref:hypothetical protein n=1 Tax=Nocardioides convexus TaxID=2712224 RepID=UPI00241815C2|nr:hypothetical protein [Nocardioides convexus]NHA01641.1 hypothetical protein [Nocardioides convexus]